MDYSSPSMTDHYVDPNTYVVLTQWRIQDFPEGGREPSRGGVNTPNFPENCMKSKEFGRPGGGVRPSRPPLDPPMLLVLFDTVWFGTVTQHLHKTPVYPIICIN